MASKRRIIKKLKKELKKDKLLLLETVLSVAVFLFVISLTLLSLFTPKHCVTFDSNGGTIITSKIVKHNKVVNQPVVPVKEGYEFIGWYYNDELYSFDKGVTDDIKLVAKWEKIKKAQIKNIEINAEDFSMSVNQNIKLPYTITPLVDEKIFWESSDSSIVEVDGSGNITSKTEGVATIKVSTTDGVYDEIKVTVDKNTILLDEMSFESKELYVDVGTLKQLNLVLKPIDASNQNVMWSSDDTSIVAVDNNGVINAKKRGRSSNYSNFIRKQKNS